MGIAGQHLHSLYLLATYFVVPNLIRSLLAKLDKAMTLYNDEGFPLGVMPMLSLGDTGFGDVNAHLSAVERVHQFGE